MIEFFFDCSSPWTYLAFHNIQPLAKEFGADIVWRPILVGGIFNTINPSVYAQREHPVEAKVAAILRAMWPDLPMPETMTRPSAPISSRAAWTNGSFSSPANACANFSSACASARIVSWPAAMAAPG